MNDQKKLHVIIGFLYVLVCFFIMYGILRYALYWFFPFLLGFLIASLLKPMIRKLHLLTHIHKRFWSVLMLTLFYGITTLLLTLLMVKAYTGLREFILNLPTLYDQQLRGQLITAFDQFNHHISRLDPAILRTLSELGREISVSLGDFVATFSSKAVFALSHFAGALPKVLINFIITILASVFFTLDYQTIVNFILRQFSDHTQVMILAIRHFLKETCVGYGKAYFKIMIITGIELYVGLLILGVSHAGGLAIGIALFDVLPVLGCGGIMIPWLLVCLLLGQQKLAIGLLILYLVITLVHNLIEPKIVGKQVGLHPLLMLLAMFVGARFFGFLGFILLPLFMSVVKNLNDEGYIRLFH